MLWGSQIWWNRSKMAKRKFSASSNISRIFFSDEMLRMFATFSFYYFLFWFLSWIFCSPFVLSSVHFTSTRLFFFPFFFVNLVNPLCLSFRYQLRFQCFTDFLFYLFIHFTEYLVLFGSWFLSNIFEHVFVSAFERIISWFRFLVCYSCYLSTFTVLSYKLLTEPVFEIEISGISSN